MLTPPSFSDHEMNQYMEYPAGISKNRKTGTQPGESFFHYGVREASEHLERKIPRAGFRFSVRYSLFITATASSDVSAYPSQLASVTGCSNAITRTPTLRAAERTLSSASS